jgi:hypothetical protein
MGKEYDFSGGVRGRASRRRVPAGASGGSARRGLSQEDALDEPLTRAQIQELRRRVADYKDPVRYIIVTGFGPKFALYYNVSDDVYVMNNPSGVTMFKRRSAALAVKRLLGPRTRVIRCMTRRRSGVRVPVLFRRKLAHRPKGRRKPAA